MHTQESIPRFQERLFSKLNLNPISILTSLLRDPLRNINKIETFFDIFRAETDFELVSKLSKMEREQRDIEIGKEITSTGSVIYYTLYNSNAKPIENLSYDKKPLKTRIIKSILAIIGN